MEPIILAHPKNTNLLIYGPNRYVYFLQCIVSYVNGNSLLLTFREEESPEVALMQAHNALQSWKKLLQYGNRCSASIISIDAGQLWR